ncbi:MAG: hypothetical protein AAFU79_06290 [Myxococcota bacterium]
MSGESYASSDRTSPRHPRALFLSPAAATLVFVGARLCVGLGASPEGPAAGLAAGHVSSAESPRVVVKIRSVASAKKRPHRVPSTESELLELLRRDGTVLFTAEEADVVEVPAQEFSLEEVGVITVAPRSR